MATSAHEVGAARASSPRWSLRRWFTLIAGLAVAVSLIAVVAGTVGIVRLSDARSRLTDQLDPAAKAAQNLSEALINQETGVRGFVITGQEEFLDPFTTGRGAEQAAREALRRLLRTDYPEASSDLEAATDAAQRWRDEYAAPTMDAVRTGTPLDAAASTAAGKALFDRVRVALEAETDYLDIRRSLARSELSDAANTLVWIFVVVALVVVGGAGVLIVGLRRGVIRPILRLTGQVRAVAAGDFRQVVDTSGPAELAVLGHDVNTMRQQIVAELLAVNEANRRLDEQAHELQRSNAELEQFAYVASHDLQEPLRKVASFCQLLEQRFHDKLDDRGRQYIDFAVDGATRMQALINDLLAFSRVGRLREESAPVDGNQIVRAAHANLAAAIEDSGATVTADPMPTLYGDRSLLATVLQNLIGNAIKFRRPDHPVEVHLAVRPDGDSWLFTCSDNGIGIEAEYAERIFTIFQRLHPKGSYPGTGIGLSMCRKIVEYHGGRIWLEPRPVGSPSGSTFCFTLPQGPRAVPSQFEPSSPASALDVRTQES